MHWTLILMILRIGSATAMAIGRQDGAMGNDTLSKLGNGSPRDVVYHEQVTDTLQCDPFNECSIANEEEQTIQVSFSASIIPAQRIDAGFSVAKSWSTGVSHECSGGPGDTVCLWARTPYVEYEVHNIEYDTCSVFGTDTERYRIKSPNKNEDVRPYCVVGIEYCRNKGDNYWQFDGLEEYPYWYHKGR
ncbi:uncharacterized protein LTHEOB_5817 [Lasiodiplodia theobromae]|uniref:uncharacterized protein n=1 Tax=Lasiodiplodia theobromae TaxID=45133 RepID=UPI0015C36B8F|nr:uncharacterized protein LTHEOB_5817 [Lasiodiplodia theobromae]KAF4544808.1 hypothetical protein LTHEOB_5817 [Lasiodiplodia theobromae]